MSLYPTIDQYLLSTCLFIIDEFNELYKGKTKLQLKEIADEQFNEMDICVRVGYPFRQMAHYTVGDKKDGVKSNHDIYVMSRNFKIEVKYLKNWDSASGTKSASKNWDTYQGDFDWIPNEIRNGSKGKVAFIIGWFNCVDSFSRLIQLGEGNGNKPLANERRVSYFPFLKKRTVPTYTTDLLYNYDNAYKELQVCPIGENNTNYNCIFLGNENDLFHFAIYY